MNEDEIKLRERRARAALAKHGYKLHKQRPGKIHYEMGYRQGYSVTLNNWVVFGDTSNCPDMVTPLEEVESFVNGLVAVERVRFLSGVLVKKAKAVAEAHRNTADAIEAVLSSPNADGMVALERVMRKTGKALAKSQSGFAYAQATIFIEWNDLVAAAKECGLVDAQS